MHTLFDVLHGATALVVLHVATALVVLQHIASPKEHTVCVDSWHACFVCCLVFLVRYPCRLMSCVLVPACFVSLLHAWLVCFFPGCLLLMYHMLRVVALPSCLRLLRCVRSGCGTGSAMSATEHVAVEHRLRAPFQVGQVGERAAHALTRSCVIAFLWSLRPYRPATPAEGDEGRARPRRKAGGAQQPGEVQEQ